MSYDPYAYGQVQLGGKPAEPAASPDDLLFASPPAPTAGPAAATADSSWELLQADVASLLPSQSGADPVEFGTEILGEAAPAPVAQPRPKAGGGRSAAPRRAEAAATNAPSAAAAGGGGGVAAGGALSGAKVTRPVAAAAAKPVVRPPAGLAATLLPGLLLAGGGTAAAWLWFSAQNPVLGGIAAGLAAVGAAFAFVWTRR
jgi:hypothetical protein